MFKGMKRSLRIMVLALAAVVMGGCTAMMNTSYGSSDLYRTNNRVAVANELTAKAEADKARAEARRAEYEALIAQAEYEAMMEGDTFSSVLADTYESAYARRLYGFTSPTYRMPTTYYDLAMNDAVFYATAYDPAFYNVMISGDQVWVEPKYITSMFGSWGATNLSFGLYTSPWTYGWVHYANPFYYSWWGYPHYSWYDWNWTICYNPYYGVHWPGYYPGYWPGYPGYYPGYPGYYPPRPPHHRPDYVPQRPSRPHHNYNGNGHSPSSRYTSPTSNRNYGGGDSRGNSRYQGAVSTGINDRRTGTSTGVNGSRGNTRNNNTSNYRPATNTGRSDNFRPTTYDNRNNTSRGTVSNGGSSTNRGGFSGSAGSRSGGGARTGGSTSSRR